MYLRNLLIVFAMLTTASAQDDTTAAQYKAETERIQAEAARSTAEASRLDSQTKLLKAQQEKQTAEDPAVAAAAKEKSLAELKKATADANKAAAEADKATLAATLPEFKTEPLKGTVTADEKAGYFVQVLGYDALRTVADKIVDALEKSEALKSGGKVFLVGTADQLHATGLRLLIRGKLSAFDDAFKNLKTAAPREDGFREESAFATLAATRAAVGVAADIAAFFRQDREIKGKEFQVDAKLMMQAVAGAWLAKHKSSNVTFINPSAIVKVSDAQKSTTLLGRFEGLETTYVELIAVRDRTNKWNEQLKLQLPEKKEALETLKKASANPPTPEEEKSIREASAAIRRMEGVIRVATDYLDHAKAILGSYRTFADSLTVIAEGKKESVLASVFASDLLASNPDKGYLLEVSVATIGGEMELRKWLWSPGKVHHRAGAVCHYALWQDTGVLLASGILGADVQVAEGKKSEVSVLK